jgi:putative Mg2+ transporter-C (MgtC) family protein
MDWLTPENGKITIHLLSALVAGGVIGIERSYHGRPAGFRTHTLVSLASALLMLVTLYQSTWIPGSSSEAFRTDPTRMAQGIMTGIGFLGAGVIYKEGFSIRGLTTAGSIWITAAIGILFGIGFYYPAILATILCLGILGVFRLIEIRMPTQAYAHYRIRFDRDDAMNETDLRALLLHHGFSVANMSYRIVKEGRLFEYSMVLRTEDKQGTSKLAHALRQESKVKEFRLTPTGD